MYYGTPRGGSLVPASSAQRSFGGLAGNQNKLDWICKKVVVLVLFWYLNSEIIITIFANSVLFTIYSVVLIISSDVIFVSSALSPGKVGNQIYTVLICE